MDVLKKCEINILKDDPCRCSPKTISSRFKIACGLEQQSQRNKIS